MQDRRIHPRANFETEMSLGQDGVFAHANQRVTDVSLGGAFIRSAGNYQLGSILSVRFALGSHFITSTVIVRNARPREGVGVQFLDLSPEGSEHLRAFMERGAARHGETDEVTFL